jgi:hypothetical protein
VIVVPRPGYSAEQERSVIVAVVAVWAVQMAVREVVRVIAVRYRFMSA